MVRGRKLNSRLQGNAGVSLIELVVVLAILAVVSAGTTAQLLNSHRGTVKLQSKANMMQTMTLMHKAFGKTSAMKPRACADTLNIAAGESFDPTGETEIELAMADKTYKAGDSINGQSNFQINRMYLSDNFPLVQRANSYVSTLYLEANAGVMDLMMRMKPRAVATVVVTLNPARTDIVECNVSTQAPDQRETCDAMYGMTWNEQTGQCDQSLAMDTDFNLTACPGGTKKIGDVCLPTGTDCGGTGKLATGFDKGQVQCAQPPLNPAVGVPSLPVPPPVAGVPNQTPQPDPNAGARIPAATTGEIPPTTPSTTAPATCADMVGAANYEYCYNNLSCRPYLSEPAGPECVERTALPYSPPSSTTTPSLAPPPDYSCACNDARIANGDSCMYCIPQVDYGYGYVDFAYGVSKCTDGVLVPDPTAPVQFPPPECSGGYAPVEKIYSPSGYKFRQMDGYNNFQIQ